MSFQGDVAGIGLGELLQGLARGGRDGVLTLYGDTVSGALGMKGGLLYLLPGPDEDEETWRERSVRAWATDPEPMRESQRREAIARADRLETFYQMLETSNLHFRFEPGPLPMTGPVPDTLSLDGGGGGESPWGQGLPVEYMLLEHARMSDETVTEVYVAEHDIPRALDPSRFPPDVRDFLEQCDGTSTLQEIADRLGWPLRQCRASVVEHYANGVLRLAQPREMLAAAQKELELGRVGRASSRLTGWIRTSPPGPPPVGDAELLVGEWECGRLKHLLPYVQARHARALLRKLDSVHTDEQSRLERWQAALEANRSDESTLLHTVAQRLAATEEPEARSFTELLRLAHAFQERGLESRTRTLLRLAAHQLPANPQTRIELGRRMLETGLLQEGTRWLLDTARELIDRDEAEKATGPIRAVLKKLSDHNEAHGLLIEARALIARKRRRRWKTLVSLALVLMISLVGLVHFRLKATHDRNLTEVETNLDRPEVALDLLERHFGDDDSEEIVDLRSTVLALKRAAEDQKRSAWMANYETIRRECKDGDPVEGLRRVLDLPSPPRLSGKDDWPEQLDLLNVLTERLDARAGELDVSIHATVEELHAEERLLTMVARIQQVAEEEHGEDPALDSFFYRVSELHEAIFERRELRAQERQRAVRQQKEKDQDMLLGAARAHAAAGDLGRAVATYDRLLATEDGEELYPLLREEIEAVRRHWEGVQEANALAGEGEHAAALKRLEETCPNDSSEHILPWKVESRPLGARALFLDGSSRVTPFVVQTSDGEEVELRFEKIGFEPIVLTISTPHDVMVHMNRVPERDIRDAHRIEAIPVPVGDDHIVADRRGLLQRIGQDSKSKWKKTLETLGGIGRTPVFLPKLPGSLLVLSEDGQAWLLDASNGHATGPLDIGSPPKDGPIVTSRGIWASFEDGRIAIWEDELTPTFHSSKNLFLSQPDGTGASTPSSMAVLHRSVDLDPTLESPWTRWKVEARPDEFLILSPDGRGFTARRSGEWFFVAWEAPKALIPHGRLWVSDAEGIRSYRPDDGPLLEYDG